MKRGKVWVITLPSFILGLVVFGSVRAAPPVRAGGFIDLPAAGPLGPNLVINGGFEDGKTGWSSHGWDSAFSLDTTAPGGGGASLRVSNAKSLPTLTQPIKSGPGWYTLRARMKASGVTEAKKGIVVRLSAGSFTKCGGGRTRIVGGNTEWTGVEVQHIPILCGDELQIRVMGYGKPDGTMWVDGIELRQELPASVEYFVQYPNYRGLLFDDKPQEIRIHVSATPSSVTSKPCTSCQAEVRLEGEETGTLIAQQAFPVPGPGTKEQTIILDASKASAGSYLIRARLLDLDGSVRFTQTPYRVVKLPPSARATMRAYVDPDQVLVLGGQRVFPIGIFDTSGGSPKVEKWAARFKEIAEASINLYINYWQGNSPEGVLDALVTAAQRYGIWYLHTVNLWYEDHRHWPKKLQCEGKTATTLGADGLTACMAKALGTHPGLAGWYAVDEERADKMEQVFHQYGILRASHPDGVTLIAQNRPNQLSKWRDAGDVFAVDPFPIFGDYPNDYPQPPLAPLEMVTDWVGRAQIAVEGSRPVWGDIQFFKPTAKSHWPTYEELRSMSYMAIVTGAKGLLYWSYGEKGLSWVKDPQRKEELWQRLIKVTREIKSLEPALLSPDAPDILAGHSPTGTIRVLPKRFGNTRFLIAVNNTPKTVIVAFTLKTPARAAKVHEENREISLNGSSFTDTFGPYDAHVYVIADTG